jgi:DNA-binding PadR family transcriptional regulator
VPEINATAACVLGILELGPAPGSRGFGGEGAGMSGWDVYAAADVSLGRFWSITRSQVYRELRRLEDDGLVEAVGAEGPRERRPYRITAAGREAFSAWLGEWVSAGPRAEQLRSPLVLSVFFGEFVEPGALADLLAAHRREHVRALERLRGMDAALGEHAGRLPAHTLRRGLAYQELMVRWIDDLLAALDERRATS